MVEKTQLVKLQTQAQKLEDEIDFWKNAPIDEIVTFDEVSNLINEFEKQLEDVNYEIGILEMDISEFNESLIEIETLKQEIIDIINNEENDTSHWSF